VIGKPVGIAGALFHGEAITLYVSNFAYVRHHSTVRRKPQNRYPRSNPAAFKQTDYQSGSYLG
jgi:hypothetical protein